MCHGCGKKLPPSRLKKNGKTERATQEEENIHALGAKLMMTVMMDRQSTEALVDTGSPVTIVAFRQLLQVWKWNHPTHKNDDQWLKKAHEKLKD